MAEFTPIETQEAFDAAIKDRIERAKKSAAADAAKQYEGWIKPEDAQKSADQIAALSKQVAELTAKNQAAELSALRTRIAHETGLPFELADRLHGDDEKALRADAETLGKLTAAKPTPSPAYSPETPVASAADAAFRALASELNS